MNNKEVPRSPSTPVGTSTYAWRWAALIGQLFIYAWMLSGVHEKAHYVVADWFNNAKEVTFTFWGGHFNYLRPPTMAEDILVSLAGGLITGLLFGVLWWISHRQSRQSLSEIDTTAIFLMIAVLELIYGVAEAVFPGIRWLKEWNVPLSMGIITALLGVFYRRKLAAWLFPPVE